MPTQQPFTKIFVALEKTMKEKKNNKYVSRENVSFKDINAFQEPLFKLKKSNFMI